MAVLTLYHALPVAQPLIGLVTVADSNHLQLVAGTVTLDYYGENLSYSLGQVTGGTLTGYELRNSAAGGLQFTITGLSLPAATFASLSLSGNAQALSELVFAASDTLLGSPEGDFLAGGGGADSLVAGEGADILVADDDAVADTLVGGAGDDIYFIGGSGHPSSDTVVEAEGGGNDLVESRSSYALPSHVEQLHLAGSGASTGTGNALDNLLVGNAASNLIDGLAGQDTLDGGPGGLDTLRGGEGDDTYVVASSFATIVETATGGTDRVMAAVDFILGAHLEQLRLIGQARTGQGNELANLIEGNDADNTLDGGAGADTLEGGLGNDSFGVDSSADLVIDTGGVDTIVSSTPAYALTVAGIENLRLAGAALSGSGNDGANLLTGNGLDNSLSGLGGNDTLQGGGGSDTLSGGSGDDDYGVDSAGDLVIELPGAGTDLVRSSISWQLPAEVENLALISTAGLAGTGNALANQITGSEGADTLDGGAGTDTLSGAAGADIYHVDSPTDVVADGGVSPVEIDTVYSPLGYDLAQAADVEALVLTGLGDIDGTGNALANLITGNAGSNRLTAVGWGDSLEGGLGNDSLVGSDNPDRLDGGGGIDTMAGGFGFDTYVVDHVGDLIIEVEVPHSDRNDLVQAWVSYTLTANAEWLTLMGDQPLDGTGTPAWNETITGNPAANRIHSGGGANDDLYGMGGNDTLDAGGNHARMFGGTGDDTYIVGGSLAFIVEADGEGTDTVVASGSLTLPAHFENLTLLAGLEANGNSLDNVIVGSPDANFIDGRGGADTMSGGFGDDQYYVDSAGDVIIEADGQGYDSVVADGVSVSVAGLSIERIYLGDSANAHTHATGNALDNFIRGTDGNNVLDGGAGADEMYAWMGDDTYVVDNAGDQVFEFDGQGTDTVRSQLASFTLGEHFENLVLAPGAASGTGNSLDNVLGGNESANSLGGAGGHDTLSGGQGPDSLNGGEGNDLLDGDAGPDRAVYGGTRAGYTVTRNMAAGTVSVSGADGTDILVGVDEIAFSDQVIALNANQATGNLAVGGTLMENRTLTASATNLTDADGTGHGALSWQWFRGESAIAGATSASYLLGAADVGALMRARARFVDAAGNTETLWSAATAAVAPAAVVNGSGNDDVLEGESGSDTLNGMGGDDTLRGGAGNDSLDGGADTDTAVFTGNRSSYTVTATASGYSVADAAAGRDGTDTLSGVEFLLFSDRTADLGLAARAALIDPARLQTMQELYVGFFNRIPEAQGLAYWIGQLESGATLEAIADQFHAAGLQFGTYSADMTDAQFIAQVYDYVLGRPPGSAKAPDVREIGYWLGYLHDAAHPGQTHGTMVLQMLHDTHAYFTNHPEYGFVAAHLDNKTAVSTYYAIELGLSLNVQQDNISFGVMLADLVTPNDTSAAIALIGVAAT